MELFPGFYFQSRPSQSHEWGPQENRDEGKVPICEATFSVLLHKAKAFRDAEPWNRIRENEIIGIRDPETGGLNILSILGRGHTIFALHLHLAPEGVPFWQNALDKVPPKPEQIRILECEFFDKEEVSEPDLERIQRHGRVSRRRRGVPVFRSYHATNSPREIWQAEADKLNLAFDLLSHYCDASFPRKHQEHYTWGTEPGETHLIPVISLVPGGSPDYLSDWQIRPEPFG